MIGMFLNPCSALNQRSARRIWLRKVAKKHLILLRWILGSSLVLMTALSKLHSSDRHRLVLCDRDPKKFLIPQYSIKNHMHLFVVVMYDACHVRYYSQIALTQHVDNMVGLNLDDLYVSRKTQMILGS